jgi:hypothetical protein
VPAEPTKGFSTHDPVLAVNFLYRLILRAMIHITINNSLWFSELEISPLLESQSDNKFKRLAVISAIPVIKVPFHVL